MTHHQKTSPRGIYLLQENQRVLESVSLSAKFRTLKSLTVELEYFDPEGLARSSHIKYTVNLDHAKSVFRFPCHNAECVGGDFDLSRVLADTVAARRTSTAGEICCQGWRSKATMDVTHCHNLLRFKFRLVY
ncbi:MAG: hypothetical protein EPO07_09320 [Verrucomicrobia bacterium]|nr:MAG: hypothetical protein EPO07_09320 [Verrucomicrobiota bacterium]